LLTKGERLELAADSMFLFAAFGTARMNVWWVRGLWAPGCSWIYNHGMDYPRMVRVR
jgi:hypothetical protein